MPQRPQLAREPAPRPKPGGIKARHIRGLPDYTTVPLLPVSFQNLKAVVNPLGLCLGYECMAEAVLTWAPVKLPVIRGGLIRGCVEYGDITGKPPSDPVRAKIHWLWVTADSQVLDYVTRPLIVNDPSDGAGVFRFKMQHDQVDWNGPLSAALRVELLGSDPILIRGAWLELGEV